MSIEDKFKAQADAALEESKKETRNFAVRTIPTGLWAAATIAAAADVFNRGGGFYVVCAAIAVVGAVVAVIKTTRNK